MTILDYNIILNGRHPYLGIPYFCLNLVKLDKLGNIYNVYVETLQG